MKKIVRVIFFLPVLLLTSISAAFASHPGGYFPPLTTTELIKQADVIAS